MTLPQADLNYEPEAPAQPAPYSAGGRRLLGLDDPRLKSPVVATLLSAMPGLGQVYLGYYQQGFINALTVATLITVLNANVGTLEPLLGIFLAFFWLYNLVDAGRKASLLNQAVHRLEVPELPEGFGSLNFKGQVFGGLALVAVGSLAFAHLRFGLSLDWVRNWWPMLLVAGGIYLVWQAASERKQ